MLSKAEILELDKKNRKRLLAHYDPLTGEGSDCCERVKVTIEDSPLGAYYLPKPMMANYIVAAIAKYKSFEKAAEKLKKRYKKKFPEVPGLTPAQVVATSFVEIRYMWDFEFWAFTCIKIKPKLSEEAESRGEVGVNIPFRLNRGQRKLLKVIYKMWLARKPIRIVLLKARQWGGSTLTQIFMMWMQIVQHKQWNSVICAHVENTAKVVRGMYTLALKEYPYFTTGATEEIELTPFEGSQKTRTIKERECRISVGSSEKPDGLRGDDVNMAHFSEVAFFVGTETKKPEDIMQSIVSGIAPIADTVIVYESTAKGVGNWFHRTYLKAKQGKSNNVAVFVSWFDIESYSLPIDNTDGFIDSMTAYEMRLLESGATLEQIAWYRAKKGDYDDKWRFYCEYPSFDTEAFQSTGRRYYNIEDVNKLRKYCTAPKMVGNIIARNNYGADAMKDIHFVKDDHGYMKVWEEPDRSCKMSGYRYVVVMDVNKGISRGADNGVICVFDRYWQSEGGVPEVVAEWCGHITMRYFIWIGVMIAVWYDNAFLVIENNTPYSAKQSGFEMESVMDEIATHYDTNLYCDIPAEQVVKGVPRKYGWNTNHASKLKVCSNMQVALDRDMYIERSVDAVDEFDTFEVKDDGTLGAVEGCHDDRHITRAIGVWICWQYLSAPMLIKQSEEFYSTTTKVVNEATM